MSEQTEQMSPPPISDPPDDGERASWPTVIGWLSIVFGSIALLCNGTGIVTNVFLQGWFASISTPPGEDPLPAMTFSAAAIAFMMLKMAWGIPLVIAGIATVARKPAGRNLHLFYVIGFAITTLITAYLSYQSVQAYRNSPEVVQWLAENPNDPRGFGLKGDFAAWGTLIGIPISLAYPTFCLIWFLPAGRSERALRLDEEDALV